MYSAFGGPEKFRSLQQRLGNDLICSVLDRQKPHVLQKKFEDLAADGYAIVLISNQKGIGNKALPNTLLSSFAGVTLGSPL